MATPQESGETRELTRLWFQNQDAVYGYILATSRSVSDADDIFQNVALAAMQARAFPAEPSRFLAWCREVARRRVLEFYRNEKRATSPPPELLSRLSEVAERVDEDSSAAQRRTALTECLQALPGERRELLADRYGDSKVKIDRLAQKYGRSEQAISSLLYRIRTWLADCVEHRLQRSAN